jgi:hypothetical protein
MVKKVLVYWRDIPAQVIAQRGRKREKVLLSSRFQKAIDRAAMRAGKGSSDAYLAEWRRVSTSFASDDDLREIVDREVRQFEEDFPDDHLLQLIRDHGTEKH